LRYLRILKNRINELRNIRKRKKWLKKRDFLYRKFWPFLYRVFSKKPVDKNLILFGNGFARRMPENFKCIYARLKDEGYTCKMYFPPKKYNGVVSLK